MKNYFLYRRNEKKNNMNKIVMGIIFLLNISYIFPEEQNDFLFEDYWIRWKVYFASLSEDSDLPLPAEHYPRYAKFWLLCMQGKDNSIIVYGDRRKKVYLCSENKRKINSYIKSEQENYKDNLRQIAEVLKQGKVYSIQKLGETKDRCFIAAVDVSLELQNIDSLKLGYLMMNWAQDRQEGIFSVDGCDIKVTQVVDLE